MIFIKIIRGFLSTKPATADEIANEAFKFTSKNEGVSIRVRGGGL